MDFANDATDGWLLGSILVLAVGFVAGLGFWAAQALLSRNR